MSQTKTQLVSSPLNLNGADLTFPSSQGSANQFLRNGSTAGTLEFGALVSSNMPTGSIVQVVEANTSTEVSVTVATYTDIGLSASITPSSSSNKILVLANVPVYFSRSSGIGGGLKLLRGSTNIYESFADGTGPYELYNGASSLGVRFSLSQLDSPATTSATTYKLQGRPYVTSSARADFFEAGGSITGKGSIILMEVAA